MSILQHHGCISDSGSDLHYAHAVHTATEAIKALLLVNGGAATALIALKSSGRTDYSLPILFFGLAALLNAVTFIAGYYSQLNYANARAALEREDRQLFDRGAKHHRQYQITAITVLLLSLIASAAGMVLAFTAI